MIEQLQHVADIDTYTRLVKHPDGLEFVQVNHPRANGLLCLQGAQLLQYQATGEAPLLWLSSATLVQPGKALRGGIPICWPWFGPLEGKPQHGFARTANWTLASCQSDEEHTTLVLQLEDSESTRPLWPHPFRLLLQVELGRTLQLKLTTTNLEQHAVTYRAALHTYLACSDYQNVQVEGLGSEYIDKLDQGQSKSLASTSFHPPEALDRIFTAPDHQQRLLDGGSGHIIQMQDEGADSVVVWNPGQQGAAGMADMVADEYRRMLCVEHAITRIPGHQVEAGDSHTLTVSFAAEHPNI